MGRLFGTDGVRGVANEKLTCDLAFKLGQAGAHVLTSKVHQGKDIDRQRYQDIRKYAGSCYGCRNMLCWSRGCSCWSYTDIGSSVF